ncbi:MAG: tRNA pseudouridine(55) synthase TruB [Chlamydiota bacterium]
MKRKKTDPQSCLIETPPEGILLLNKAKGVSSFSYVPKLRKLLNIKKIGHAGTLDPLATGLLILLIGKSYTKQAATFLQCTKEYTATFFLGKSTTTYDAEGSVTKESPLIPQQEEIDRALSHFQGDLEQTPPMFSAKKVQGKKLYELARKNIQIDLKPCKIHLQTTLLSYNYPYLHLKVHCSKGTYIRSLAHDFGQFLGTNAFLYELTRTKVGPFSLENALSLESIDPSPEAILEHLIHETPQV